jgi:teichuronic acid biosynthesis glycosyltransferase TuaC
MAATTDLKVIAPVPLLDYLHPSRKLRPRSAVPVCRRDERLEVFHPRWLYPPLGTPLNIFCLYARVFQLAVQMRHKFPFQVIDAHFGYPEGVAGAILAATLRCPFIVTLRGNEIKFGEYRFRRVFMQWALRRAARVITVSEELRHFAISLGAEPARVKTIPNGIDLELFGPRDRSESRRKFGIPEKSLGIVCVGELVERKGHHLVVQALKQILDRGMDASLWIAGTGGRDGPVFEGVIRHLIANLGLEQHVHLLGFVPRTELAHLMSAADVFCLPSTLEGWPNVVHEASACGAPVVATKVGGVPEMLPDERYGFVVPVGDQQALETALLTALEKKWDRDYIAAWGRSRSWAKVAAEVLVEIESVLSVKRYAHSDRG